MNQLQLLRALTLGAALALSGAVCYGQPLIPESVKLPEIIQDPQDPTAPAKTTIKVGNMNSELMVYWLQPYAQKVPDIIQRGLSNGNFQGGIVDKLPRQPGNFLGPLDPKLPAGVETLRSVSPQNVIIATGTPAGLEALHKLVAQLDVPLKQTEIEVLLVEMAPDEMEELALPFRWTGSGDGGDKTWPAIAEVSQAAAKRLDNLRQLADQTAAIRIPVFFKVINAPRVTALDGLTATLMATESRGLYLLAAPETKMSAEGEAETPRPAADAWQTGIATIQNSTGIRVKCASKDDLIAIDLQIDLNNQAAQMSAIVRDGQKLAMLLPQRNETTGAVLVAFVTPRVIRHAN